jgi:hypothetical protein
VGGEGYCFIAYVTPCTSSLLPHFVRPDSRAPPTLPTPPFCFASTSALQPQFETHRSICSPFAAVQLCCYAVCRELETSSVSPKSATSIAPSFLSPHLCASCTSTPYSSIPPTEFRTYLLYFLASHSKCHLAATGRRQMESSRGESSSDQPPDSGDHSASDPQLDSQSSRGADGRGKQRNRVRFSCTNCRERK